MIYEGDIVVFIDEFSAKDGMKAEENVNYLVEAVLHSIITKGAMPSYHLITVNPSPSSGLRQTILGVPWSVLAHAG